MASYQAGNNFVEHRLGALDAAASEQLLRQLLPADTGFDCLGKAIGVAKGLPLHLCEIARCARAFSDGNLALDNGVRHFISHRFSQLKPFQQTLLEICAVLGAEFTDSLLEKILGDDDRDEQLIGALEQLWLIAFLDVIEPGKYVLHDLVQDSIYDHLTPIKRSHIHIRISKFFAREVSIGKDECYAPLARHCQAGGAYGEAAVYHEMAASYYRKRLASHAEVHELGAAVDCLEKLPVTAETSKSRVKHLLDLGLAWSRIRGWGGELVGKFWYEAYELSKTLDDIDLRARATNTYDTYLRDNGQWHHCAVVGDESYRLKTQVSDTFLKQGIVSSKAAYFLHTGEILKSLELYEDILEQTESGVAKASFNWFNTSHRIGAYFRSAQCLWLTGDVDQGLVRCERAMALSEQSGHPFHQAITLFHVCLFHEFDKNYEQVLEYGQELLRLSDKYDFNFYRGSARLYMAFAELNLDSDFSKLSQIKNITERQHRNGTRMFDAYWFANLAAAHLLTGNPATAHAVASTALHRGRVTNNCFWDSELHRICGDSQRSIGNVQSASRHYRQALDTASKQGAASLLQRAQTQMYTNGNIDSLGSRAAANSEWSITRS